MRQTSISTALTACLGLAALLNAVGAESLAPARWWASLLDGQLQLTEPPTLDWIIPAKAGQTDLVKVDSTTGFQNLTPKSVATFVWSSK